MLDTEDYEFVLMYIGHDKKIKCRNVTRLSSGEEYEGPDVEDVDDSEQKLKSFMLHLKTDDRSSYVGEMNLFDQPLTAASFLELHLVDPDLHRRMFEIMCDITHSHLNEGAIEV